MEFARRIDRDREPFALFVARFSLLRSLPIKIMLSYVKGSGRYHFHRNPS